MTEKLKQYLKVEVNHQILRIYPNRTDSELESFFDSIYLFISQIEKGADIPAIALNNVNTHFAQMKSDEEKRIFVKAILLVLNQDKYSTWQFKIIFSELKKFSNVLENTKFLSNLGNTLKPAVDIVKQDLIKRGQERQTEKLIKLIKSYETEKEAKSKEIKLFQFNPNIKDVEKVVRLIYSTFLDCMYIEVDYEDFERHFFDNGARFKQISWESEITKLKGFVDLMFIESLIKPIKNSNVFIAAHFTDHGKPILPRNLGNVNAKKEYMEICHDKLEDHPIVKIVNKVKAEITQ